VESRSNIELVLEDWPSSGARGLFRPLVLFRSKPAWSGRPFCQLALGRAAS